jgi:hypothetical protein
MLFRDMQLDTVLIDLGYPFAMLCIKYNKESQIVLDIEHIEENYE